MFKKCAILCPFVSEDSYRRQGILYQAYSCVRRNLYVAAALPVAGGLLALLLCARDPVAEQRSHEALLQEQYEHEKKAKRTTFERLMRQPDKHVFPAIDGLLGNGDAAAPKEKPKEIKNE